MLFSPEIFQNISFPICITDKSGTVVYKNAYCRRYIPDIRCGAKIFRLLKDKITEYPKESVFCVEVRSYDTFFRALAMRKLVHGEESVMLFFPAWIQCKDYEKGVNYVRDVSDGDPIRLYAEIYNSVSRVPCPRLYGDMASIAQNLRDDMFHKENLCDVEDILSLLFRRLSGAFNSFGIRISTEIDKNVFPNRFAYVNEYEYIMFLCRLVYIAIRCSCDNVLSLTARYEKESDSISVEIKTRSECDINSKNIVSFVPECALEGELFSKVKFLDNSTSVRKCGDFLKISYTISCYSSTSLCFLRSDSSLVVMDDVVAANVKSIRCMIKENL